VDKDWVWPRDLAYRQLHASNEMVEDFASIYSLATPWVVDECSRFITYFWPMYSFWSQESVRRIEAFPESPTPEQTKKLQHFVRQASYLNCVWWQDPRAGTNWSAPVTEHMQMVRERPSTDLEMPDLPEWFKTVTKEFMYVHDACIFWTSTMTCNLGYIARDIQGEKELGNDICWDKVQIPDYGYSMHNHSLMPHRKSIDQESYHHPEYLKCQEKPIGKEVLDHFCPFAGHYPDGMLNVSSWGHGPEKGTQRYNDVLKCEAKLDVPSWASCGNYPIHRPDEGNFIDVMKPFQGPMISYAEMQENLENGTIALSGVLAKWLAKEAALKSMGTSESELNPLQKAGLDAVTGAAGQAAEAAAKKVVGANEVEVPVYTED